MIYALIVNDWGGTDIYPCDSSRFEFEPKEENYFSTCLEDYLQSKEGRSHFPTENNPWIFVKGNSEEEIKAGKYEVIVKLHVSNKDSMWDFFGWVQKAVCVCSRLVVDY